MLLLQLLDQELLDLDLLDPLDLLDLDLELGLDLHLLLHQLWPLKWPIMHKLIYHQPGSRGRGPLNRIWC